jgi:hypothetical protein
MIRHDGPNDTVVISRDGRERPPHLPWDIWQTGNAVRLGVAEEMDAEEAERLIAEARKRGGTT